MNPLEGIKNIFRLFAIVPEKNAYIVQRFGKFHKVMEAGFGWMVPIVDEIAYRHSLKEQSIDIDKQTVITKDNVSLQIDGVLFIRIVDPIKASYKVERPHDSIRLLALTVMRSQIGKLKLDQLLQERDKINKEIHSAVNKASNEWGIQCLRYEILGIDPPEEIRKAMEYEVQAERIKRQEILISQAKKIAKINEEDGRKKSLIMEAEGKAEAVCIVARKEKQANDLLNKHLHNSTIKNYILMNLYYENYNDILKNSNVIVVPKDQNGTGNPNILPLALLGMHNHRQTYDTTKIEETLQEMKKAEEKPIGHQAAQPQPAKKQRKYYYEQKQLLSDDEDTKDFRDSRDSKEQYRK